MDIFKKRFEEDLRNKVNSKRATNVRDQQFIFKKFKHYDIQDTGSVDFKAFLNVMEGCGVNITNKKLIQELYNSYLQDNEFLNYSSFISQIFGQFQAETVQTNEDRSLSPFKGRKTFNNKDNSFLNFNLSDTKESQRDERSIILKFQKSLKAKGDLNEAMSLLKSFTDLDSSGKRQVSENQFLKIIKNLHLNLTESDIKSLYQQEAFQIIRQFSYVQFIKVIFSPINQFREQLISEMFSQLDVQQVGNVDIEYIIDQFDPSKQPDVINGKKSVKQSLQDFLRHINIFCQFRENSKSRGFQFQEFLEFYKIISYFTEGDQDFKQVVCNGWKFAQVQLEESYDNKLENNFEKNRGSKRQSELDERKEEMILNKINYQNDFELNELQENKFNQSVEENKLSNQKNNTQTKQMQKSDIFHLNENESSNRQHRFMKNYSRSPNVNRYNIINHVDQDRDSSNNQQKHSKRMFISPFSENKIFSNNNQEQNYDYNKKKREMDILKSEINNILSQENNNQNGIEQVKRQASKQPFQRDSGNILSHQNQQEDQHTQIKSGKKVYGSPKQQQYNIISNISHKDQQNKIYQTPNKQFEQNIFNPQGSIQNQFQQNKQQQEIIQNDRFPSERYGLFHTPGKQTFQDQHQTNKQEDFNRVVSYRYDNSNQEKKGKRCVTPQREIGYNIISNQSNQHNYNTPQKQNYINNENNLPNQNLNLTPQNNIGDRTLTKIKQEREQEENKINKQNLCLTLFLKKLVERGPKGFINFWNKIDKIYQQQGNAYCDFNQFQQLMQTSRFDFNQEELEFIFSNFDKDSKRQINGNDILKFFRGKGLNKTRQANITKIYNSINQFQQSQQPSYQKILDSFKPKNCSDVRKGKISSEQLLIDFVDNFERHHELYTQSQNLQSIDLTEFISFISLYSLQFEEDNQFENFLFQSFVL